ncbi:MAG: DUF4383 domain-containing protein [Actinomycetota bacterium]|jgi:hypothetical protein|nr:DUF4383 domain-containing protein [Actinomycetota bacterium]
MSGHRGLVAKDDSTVLSGHRHACVTAGSEAGRTSLGWVPYLLPHEEGMAWWAEVTSCLAETADAGERRRYVHSYRRSVPQLIWTSWTSQVRQARPAPATVETRVTSAGLDILMVTPEDKFGIKMRASKAPRTPEQRYSLVAGGIYLVAGFLGFFVTGFSNFTEMTNHALLGIFMVNPFHNIVHLALGVFWLLAAFALTPAATEGMNVALGTTFLLATVLGWLGLFSVLSIPGGASADNVLHLITAAVTFAVGCGLLRGLFRGWFRGLSSAGSGQPATA